MLNDVNSWSFLKNINCYCNNINKKDISKSHHRTIYNKHLYWVKKNVFYNAFYNYHCFINTNILLDATSIYNKYDRSLITF